MYLHRALLRLCETILHFNFNNIKTSNTVFLERDQHKVQTLSNDIDNIDHAGSLVGALERNSVHEICPLSLI